MAAIRPFRALRAKPSRIDPGVIVVVAGAPTPADDPRSLARVLRPNDTGGAAEVATTRARFHLAELQRAGLLARDAAPALYVLRVVDGERARTGFFAAVRGDVLTIAPGVVDDGAPGQGGATFDVGVVGDAVIVGFSDKKGRVARSLETETEREPDAAFRAGGRAFELWVLDEETAAARVTALVEAAAPRVLRGAQLLTAASAAARAHPPDTTSPPGATPAAGFCLGFFVDDEAPLLDVPAGIVLLPVSAAP
jgi:hypothetical protein